MLKVILIMFGSVIIISVFMSLILDYIQQIRERLEDRKSIESSENEIPVSDLFNKIRNEGEYIGEYFFVMEYECMVEPCIETIKFKNVQDRVGKNIKINNNWYLITDVIFYDDIYNKQRNEIRKRLTNKNLNGDKQ